FSSRRRHTRFSRDWSSDVCSSDLPKGVPERMVVDFQAERIDHEAWRMSMICFMKRGQIILVACLDNPAGRHNRFPFGHPLREVKIGRASCRERVETAVGMRGVRLK